VRAWLVRLNQSPSRRADAALVRSSLHGNCVRIAAYHSAKERALGARASRRWNCRLEEDAMKLWGYATLTIASLSQVACGGEDDAGSSNPALSQRGVDGSKERREIVVKIYCERAIACNDGTYDTQAQCETGEKLDIGLSTKHPECIDARLDERSCQAQVEDCEQFDFDACEAQQQAASEACADLF
jgi:hypothetical protein